MEFLYKNLGYLHGDEIIEVTLDTRANVCLLDTTNFYNYKNGRDFSYRGGYADVSPYRIAVPYAGTWYVTIDLAGYSGTIKYSINVIKPMQEIKPVQKTLRKNLNFVCDDGTIVFYDELSEEKVKLTSAIRDGMSRSYDKQIFNSLKELKDYCKSRRWSRY